MPAIEATGPNAAQITYWNTTAGSSWVEMQDLLDGQLKSLGWAVMKALDLKRGEQVIDVGCGCGSTTLDLGQYVGNEGRVVAVDISEPMLALAQARAGAAGLESADFILADAQTADFPSARADAVFSRFGVMFFADPAAAFANLRSALKPGGRIGFVCWRAYDENVWMRLPFEVAMTVADAPTAPIPMTDPNAPGPFAFADADRLRGILETAGFAAIDIKAHDEAIGVGDMERTLMVVSRIGRLPALLAGQPENLEPVMAAIRKALTEYDGPDGVRIPSAAWIVTARNP